MESRGWKPHLKSKQHTRAVEHESRQEAQSSAILHAVEEADREEATGFAPISAPGPSVLPMHLAGPSRRVHEPSPMEQELWDSVEAGEADFDLGTKPNEDADQLRVENETNFDIWNADAIMDGVDGSISDANFLDEPEDDILSEVLRNARKFSFQFIDVFD